MTTDHYRPTISGISGQSCPQIYWMNVRSVTRVYIFIKRKETFCTSLFASVHSTENEEHDIGLRDT